MRPINYDARVMTRREQAAMRGLVRVPHVRDMFKGLLVAALALGAISGTLLGSF